MITIQTKVQKAEIYYSGATVTRRGMADLEEGKNLICITGLPDRVDRDSLKVSIPGSSMQGPVSIQKMNTGSVDEVNSQIEELKEKLLDLDMQIGTAADICDLFKTAGKSSGAGTVLSEDRYHFMQGVAQQYSKEREKFADLQKQRRNALKELEQLNKKLEELRENVEMVAVLTVMVESADSYEVEMEYQDQKVLWKPVCDITVPSVNDSISIVLNAVVNQSTGEDWDDVELILHTGNPEQQLVMPQLHPWTLHKVPKYREPGVYMRMSGEGIPMPSSSMNETTVLATSVLADSAAPPRNVLSDGPEVNSVVAEYRIKGSWSIPSNEAKGDGTIILIDQFLLGGEFTYSCVPKYSDKVFLTALIKNLPIDKVPASKASLYFEGRYVGQMNLDSDMMLDGLTLALGVDRGMKAARKQIGNDQNNTFMSGRTRRTLQYELTIQNSKDSDVVVKVYDQIPITNDNQVTIESYTDPVGTLNSETGELTWDLTVPARKKARAVLTCVVTYPQNERFIL